MVDEGPSQWDDGFNELANRGCGYGGHQLKGESKEEYYARRLRKQDSILEKYEEGQKRLEEQLEAKREQRCKEIEEKQRQSREKQLREIEKRRQGELRLKLFWCIIVGVIIYFSFIG